MIGYAAREIFTAEHLGKLTRAERLVSLAPEWEEYLLDWGPPTEVKDPTPIRCHELARAVGKILELPVQDGKYGFIDHTWLWLAEPEQVAEAMETGLRYMMPNVLDVYVAGSLPMVQLYHAELSGLPRQYSWGPERTDIRVDIVDRLIRLLRATESPLFDPHRANSPRPR